MISDANDVLKTVMDTLIFIAPDLEDIGPNTPLTGPNSQIDSVGLLSLLVMLEEAFDYRCELTVTSSTAGKGVASHIETVGLLAEFITKQLSS